MKRGKINFAIITLIVVLIFLFVGSPLKEKNIVKPVILISIYSIVYYIYIIVKKEKILFNKLDIFIALLLVASGIPIIFRTYVSLESSLLIFMEKIALLNLYIILKNEINNDRIQVQDIIDVLIGIILFLCVIGIDDITFNVFYKFKKIIGCVFVANDEGRISSLFAYPNTCAIVASVGMFLCVGRFFCEPKLKNKILYTCLFIIMFITVVFTYSRLTYIFLFLISMLFICVIIKKYSLIKKITLKKFIIYLISIICIFITYIFIGLNSQTKLPIVDRYQKILYKIEPNSEYKFNFNISSELISEEDFKIIIYEKNEYFDDIYLKEYDCGNINGNYIIDMVTQESTKVIYIEFINKDSKVVEINSLYINNEEIVLKYKLLPVILVDKVKSISFQNKSAWERIVFIKDTFKLIKENYLFGYGGNAWRTLQIRVQEYNYYSKECHCFLAQTFLENGIVAFILILLISSIILLELLKLIKNNEKKLEQISYMFSIILLAVHSLFDFNLSFLCVETLLIILLATCKINLIKININKKNIFEIIIFILSIILLYLSVSFEIDNYIGKNKCSNNVCTKLYKFIPYGEFITKKYFYSNGNDFNFIKKMIDNDKYHINNIKLYKFINLDITYNDEQLKYILNYVKDTEDFCLYNPDIQQIRLYNMKIIINRIDKNSEMCNEFIKQLENEVRNKEYYLLDYVKCRYKKVEQKMYYNFLEGLVE